MLRSLLLMAMCQAISGTVYMLKMRDGVELHTETDEPPFFPAGKKVPAILERSPYGANAEELIATVFAELLGYVSVRQDMRGTGQSGGNFSLWHDSQADAYDTLEWITKQPWNNGMVFTTGASADGIDEYAQMSTPHPALRGQVVIFASAAEWETFYPGGAYREALIDGWLKGTVPSQYAELDAFVRQEEQPGTPWWQVLNGTNWYPDITWPSLHWGGWYDIFQQGNLMAYEGYKQRASLPGQAKLVMDPLGHCQSGASFFSRDVIFGRVTLPILMALSFMSDDSATNRTYPNPPEGVGNVTLYVMGANEAGSPGQYWTTIPDYPTPTPQKWYLNSGGSLTVRAPTSASASTAYSYDPSNPVHTVGGNNLLIPCGPLDQREIEKLNRQDVLIYTSDALTAPMALTGAVEATIYMGTNTLDTDIVVKLIDVYPEDSSDPKLAGSSTLVLDGIARMRWRDFPSTNEPQLLSGNTGDVYVAKVHLWNTSYIFAPGHKVRVHVSSSNWPRFFPNPNTGVPVSTAGPNVTAAVTIHMDASHASHITLPIVDAATQLPSFPVEETVREALKPYEATWRASRQAMGETREETFEAFLSRRMEAVGNKMFKR